MGVFSLRMCLVYTALVWANRHSVCLCCVVAAAEKQAGEGNVMGVLPCWRWLRTKAQVHVIKRKKAKVNKLEYQLTRRGERG